MTAQQLKNSILQMAVQGKLVPQDPNDEPASVLLERICAEKERLIKEKKLKREKKPSVIFRGADNLPYEKVGDQEPVCIADEVPFEIPETWEWARLGKIVYNRGQITPNTLFCYIDIGSIDNENQKLNPAETIIAPDKAPSRARKIVEKGDILYSTVRPYLHNMCIIDREYTHMPIASTGFAVMSCYDGILNSYLFYYLMSPAFDAYANNTDNAKGVAYPAINDERLYKALIPIPPVAEQYRIVEIIETLTNPICEYGNKEVALRSLNNNFPELLKKSILQQAIQGKLVAQDPNDEPASVLLERIRAEKEQLIMAGKIKRDKHESIIFRRDNSHYEKRGSEEVCIDEEIPFEVPENWSWCRASSLGTMVRGRGIKRTETVAQGCPCIRYGEIYTTYETSFDAAVSFIPESLDKDCLHFSSGDVVFTLTGENKVDIAKTVAFLGDGQIAAGGDLAFWAHHGMNPLYLAYYMASPYCIELKRRTATGDIIVHISTSKVGDFLVPVPPLDEQNRIVSAIERLFAVASTL